MSENKKDNSEHLEKTQENKTELAKRIANQSKRMASGYQAFGDRLLRIVRWFSSVIDKVLFNRKHARLTALVLAIILYAVVNFNTLSSIIANPLEYSRRLEDVPVVARYNSDTFELSGLDETVDVVVYGDATSVTNSLLNEGKIIADLEGLDEGTHDVKLKAEGYGNGVEVATDPSNVVITLKKKTTAQFEVSYDLIHLDQMENIYSVGTPVFESATVNVRASKDTLDTIAFVKALIDVSNKAEDFDQEARLVAYDDNGNLVNAEIVPNVIKVHVPVTSPNKTVPVEVQISGEVPDNMAISSITLDQQAVTIYGAESTLQEIDKVVVTLNASTITKDSTILRPVVLPTGVSTANINQISLSVTVGELKSRTIRNVPINYINNTNNFKASQPDNKTTTSVIITGTQENINMVTAEDINVYIDLINATPGLQEFQLQVDQPSSGLVKYALEDATYELNILGETEDIEENSGGNEADNG